MPPVDDTTPSAAKNFNQIRWKLPAAGSAVSCGTWNTSEKWLLLGIVIGVIAGLGAVVFYLAMRYTGDFLLGDLAGYRMPTPKVEGGSAGVRTLPAAVGASVGDDGRCVGLSTHRGQVRSRGQRPRHRQRDRGDSH